MRLNLITALLLALLGFDRISVAQSVPAAASLAFTDFAPAGNSEKNWVQAADVSLDPAGLGSAKIAPGNGIIIYTGDKVGSTLGTKNNYGDTEVEFDFLLNKGATFSVLLQGRYRVNLADSWQTQNPVVADMGGIGPLKQNAGAFGGLVPSINVAKAPGLWQHARIRFRAPQFNGTNKAHNALFEEVYVNGCLVQQNAEVQAPSAGSIADNEESTGPLVFLGGNGLAAIKGIKITMLDPIVQAPVASGRRVRRLANPMILNPNGRNYLLRSFVNFNGKKRTHVVSLGSPAQVNYSYDVKQGALLQVWHGPFMDVTEMWEQRGEPQLAVPLGSVVPLSDAPALAKLVNENTVWPDSAAFDDVKNLGYTLDKQRNPTFEYETGGYHVADKISPDAAGRNLIRELTVTGAPQNLYYRIARGAIIKAMGKGLYIIGNNEYYVQVDEKFKPQVRYITNAQELLVPVTDNSTLTYSLIW